MKLLNIYWSLCLIGFLGSFSPMAFGVPPVEYCLELDSDSILAGEPISGEVRLRNNTGSPIIIFYGGSNLFSESFLHMEGQKIQFSVFPYRKFGQISGDEGIRQISIPAGGEFRNLVFLYSFWDGSLAGGQIRYISEIDGEYQLSASIALMNEMGKRELIRSNHISISISPAGKGHEEFINALGKFPLDKPFVLCPKASASNLKHYGEYSQAMERTIAYQHGERLETLLYFRLADPHRDEQFVLESILGGMVGDPNLKVNAWRRAMLKIHENIYGSAALKNYNGEEDYDSFLVTIPRSQP